MSDAPVGRFPSRCRPRTHTTASLPAEAAAVRLHGRLLALGPTGGRLMDGAGVVGFAWQGGPSLAGPGDLVEVSGSVRAGQLTAARIERLAPVRRAPWVHRGDPEGFARAQAQRRRMLEMRARVVQEVRGFFAARGFLEVETPILVPAPGQEAHLEPFRTRYRNGRHADRFLVTSPEHHMKRLLGDGFERVFQIGRCFRNGEVSPTHNPEFTMVEWYRAYAACDEVLVDVEELVSQVSRTLRSAPAIPWQGHQVGCRPPWPRISVRQAFAEFAGVDLERCGTAAELVDQARAAGCASVGTQDTWDDAFYKLLLEKVEPALAGLGAAFLTEYPARMAALAKLKEGDPRVAERAEAYVCGIELANGFTELNDPDEQRRRFAAEADRRRSRGGPPLPRDEEFLRAMEEGMPPAGGMALGLDRLVMLMADAPAIDQVLAFPFRV